MGAEVEAEFQLLARYDGVPSGGAIENASLSKEKAPPTKKHVLAKAPMTEASALWKEKAPIAQPRHVREKARRMEDVDRRSPSPRDFASIRRAWHDDLASSLGCAIRPRCHCRRSSYDDWRGRCRLREEGAWRSRARGTCDCVECSWQAAIVIVFKYIMWVSSSIN